MFILKQTKGLVSKETVVLRQWGGKTQICSDEELMLETSAFNLLGGLHCIREGGLIETLVGVRGYLSLPCGFSVMDVTLSSSFAIYSLAVFDYCIQQQHFFAIL